MMRGSTFSGWSAATQVKAVSPVMNVNYYFPSATIISSVWGAPYRGPDFGRFLSLFLLFLASSAR
jgi:hypothetical protein